MFTMLNLVEKTVIVDSVDASRDNGKTTVLDIAEDIVS